MEAHMLSDIGAKDVADAVHISPSYFQKSFKIVTGYSIGEYLRNRRLYLAGLDVLNTGCSSRKNSNSRTYQGGAVPEGMSVFEIPASEWAKFNCIGRIPENLQTVNTRIFSEWLPGNQEFEMSLPMNIEWYSCGNTQSDDYNSAIWIPVKRL